MKEGERRRFCFLISERERERKRERDRKRMIFSKNEMKKRNAPHTKTLD